MPIRCLASVVDDERPDQVLLVLDPSASRQLPSRGMVMVAGLAPGGRFQAALEPDGNGSHWFLLDRQLAGGHKEFELELEPLKQWPEPKVPSDLDQALASDPEARSRWTDITAAARWDWIRWIGTAKQRPTRERRIEATCSMLKQGKRRPCCFNREQRSLTDA